MQPLDKIPHGGWHYPVKWEGGTHKLTAPTRDKLIEKIKEFRATNDIPMGNPAAEVQIYVDRGRAPRPTRDRSLRERVTHWKSQLLYKENKLVSPEIAEERAKICSTCPQNQQEWADSCVECVSRTKRNLRAIRQNQDTPTIVGACDILGQDNMTSVWLDESALKRRSAYLNKLPDHCWIKKLDKE